MCPDSSITNRALHMLDWSWRQRIQKQLPPTPIFETRKTRKFASRHYTHQRKASTLPSIDFHLSSKDMHILRLTTRLRWKWSACVCAMRHFQSLIFHKWKYFPISQPPLSVRRVYKMVRWRERIRHVLCRHTRALTAVLAHTHVCKLI